MSYRNPKGHLQNCLVVESPHTHKFFPKPNAHTLHYPNTFTQFLAASSRYPSLQTISKDSPGGDNIHDPWAGHSREPPGQSRAPGRNVYLMLAHTLNLHVCLQLDVVDDLLSTVGGHFSRSSGKCIRSR